MPINTKPTEDNNDVAAMELCHDEHNMDSSSEIVSSGDESDLETRVDVLNEIRRDIGLHLMKTTKENIKREQDLARMEQQANFWKQRAESTYAELVQEKQINGELKQKLDDYEKSSDENSVAYKCLKELYEEEQKLTKNLQSQLKSEKENRFKLQQDFDVMRKEKNINENQWFQGATNLHDEVTRLTNALREKEKLLTEKCRDFEMLQSSHQSLKALYEEFKSDIQRNMTAKTNELLSPFIDRSKNDPSCSSSSSSPPPPPPPPVKTSERSEKLLKIDLKQKSLLERKVESLEKRLKESEQDRTKLNGKHADLNKRCQFLLDKVNEKRKAIIDKDGKIQKLENDKNKLNADIRKLTEEKKSARMEAYTTLNRQYKSEYAQLEEDYAKAKSELELLRKADSLKKTQIEEWQKKITLLKTDKSDLNDSVLSLKETVVSDFEKIKETLDEIDRKRQQLQDSYDRLLPTVLSVATKGNEIINRIKIEQSPQPIIGVRHAVESLDSGCKDDDEEMADICDDKMTGDIDNVDTKALVEQINNLKCEIDYYRHETASKQSAAMELQLNLEKERNKYLELELDMKQYKKLYEAAEARLRTIRESLNL